MTGAQEHADPDVARAAAEALANGKFVVLAESREADAEGNLTLAAQFATSDAIGLLAHQGLGVVRLCLTDQRCQELGLDTLIESEANWQPTTSISYRDAPGSGASTADRARTIQTAIDPGTKREALRSGGYVFPLRARPGGTLRRAGRTEAAVDLAQLAGCNPAAAMALVMNADGTVARGGELATYAEANGFALVTVADVIALRRTTEKLVERVTSARLPTRNGEFTAVGFREKLTGAHHIALVKGEVDEHDTLVRVHTECFSGDVFHSSTCGCAADMASALALIEAAGRGVLLYLIDPEGQRRLDRHAHEGGEPTTPMDEYGIGAQILADLGLKRIRILTNHPRPISGLDGFGLEVVDHVALGTGAGEAHAD